MILKKHKKVFLYNSSIGKFDSKNYIICEYNSKYNCARANSISDRMLDKDIIHNGYSYKSIGSKIQWLKQ